MNSLDTLGEIAAEAAQGDAHFNFILGALCAEGFGTRRRCGGGGTCGVYTFGFRSAFAIIHTFLATARQSTGGRYGYKEHDWTGTDGLHRCVPWRGDPRYYRTDGGVRFREWNPPAMACPFWARRDNGTGLSDRVAGRKTGTRNDFMRT